MKNKWNILSISTVLLAAVCWSCNLEKEIEIELPEYNAKTIVECYLQPGKSFQLLLTSSSSYFAPFDTATSDLLQNLLVNGAEVFIMHAGTRYDLYNQLVIDQEAQKLYNYYNPELVPEDMTNEFELFVELRDGSTITGTTKILPTVPIDSVKIEFQQNDTLARVLTYFTDIPGENNYYRRMLHQNSLDSLAMQDFTLDDRVVEDVVVFGTGYEFAEGDTIYNTLFHIDRVYFDFLESVNNAVISNGNPFGQPSPINSALGGTARSEGIFTGLSFTRDIRIVGE